MGSGEAALEQMVQARLAARGVRRDDPPARALRPSSPGSTDPSGTSTRPCSASSGDLGLGYLTSLAEAAGLEAPADPAAAQRFFADSVPVAFLYHAAGLQGANRRVKGVEMDLRGELPSVQRWWVAP